MVAIRIRVRGPTRGSILHRRTFGSTESAAPARSACEWKAYPCAVSLSPTPGSKEPWVRPKRRLPGPRANREILLRVHADFRGAALESDTESWIPFRWFPKPNRWRERE